MHTIEKVQLPAASEVIIECHGVLSSSQQKKSQCAPFIVLQAFP